MREARSIACHFLVLQENKEKTLLGHMTNAPITTEKSTKQRDNTNTSITQRLWSSKHRKATVPMVKMTRVQLESPWSLFDTQW